MTPILSMSGQARLFLMMAVIGLGAGLVWDGLRILRLYVRHADFFTHLEDLLYWLFTATVLFYILLNRNYGEIRAFCVLGMGLGMVLYFAAFSRFVMAGARRFFTLLGRLLTLLYRAVTFPFRLLWKPLSRPAAFMQNKLRVFYAYIKKVLQNLRNYVKMKIREMRRDINIIMKKV